MKTALSATFRILRHTLDLSIEEIATIGGVAPAYWQRIEDGHADPSPAWIRSTITRITDHQNP